jgi:2-polyprenyl-6-methoxyphenol hydroxylase-like FAD-dependent oxidoreductase
MMQKSKVLISGAGIAGLTLAILLKEQGYQPLVVERDKAVRGEGYMMDFFGSGWDVAERMGLAPQLHAIRYPIDSLQFVDASGGIYTSVPIDRVRRALDDKYVYLRRSDLERILYERAIAAGVEIRFGSVITALQETANAVRTTFVDGTVAEFALVFGADGVHSGVRRLVFGETRQFERFLGGYVAAYHLDRHKFEIGRALKLYEERTGSPPSTLSTPSAWTPPMCSAMTRSTFFRRNGLASCGKNSREPAGSPRPCSRPTKLPSRSISIR